MNALWWIGTGLVILAAWLGMEQLTWMQELQPGLDTLVRAVLATVVLGVAGRLNPFSRREAELQQCRCQG